MLVRALHPWGSDVPLRRRQWLALRGRFVADRAPPEGTIARVKARHPTGDYVIPFACRWSGGCWVNDRTGTPIEADVVAWRSQAERR